MSVTYMYLLQERVLDFKGESIPEYVPDTTVSGATHAEKLYNVAVKELLFSWHLGVVEEDQTNFWGLRDASLLHKIGTAKSRLSNHSQTIKDLLKAVDPDFTTPTMPATPELNNTHSYTKKLYGWAVLSNLKDLAANLMQEIATMTENGICGEDVQN
ncbi:unnamed protein product [Merluccius merluccius]